MHCVLSRSGRGVCDERQIELGGGAVGGYRRGEGGGGVAWGELSGRGGGRHHEQWRSQLRTLVAGVDDELLLLSESVPTVAHGVGGAPGEAGGHGWPERAVGLHRAHQLVILRLVPDRLQRCRARHLLAATSATPDGEGLRRCLGVFERARGGGRGEYSVRGPARSPPPALAPPRGVHLDEGDLEKDLETPRRRSLALCVEAGEA